MSLFRRNTRAREEGDEAMATAPGFAHAEPQTADHVAATVPASGREAGELDALVGDAPSSRRRGRLRRRLRHLRRVREVLLRDLGGLTFELHRVGGAEGGAVLEGKLARLSAVDREIRDLEDHLSDHRAMILREPGIGGTCAACGEIFGSEARYCWACGNPVAIGAGGSPHLAAWTTHPQLTSGQPEEASTMPLQAPSVDSTLVEQDPTAPLPRMDPETVAAVAPAANEPATGDVGSQEGAMWSEHATAPEPVADAPAEPAADAPWEQPAEPPAETQPAVADEAPAAVEAPPAEEPAEPAPPPPSVSDAWAARTQEEPAPELSTGDPLKRPAQS